MKFSKSRKLAPPSTPTDLPPSLADGVAAQEMPSLPAIVASAFGKTRLTLRARLLRRLLIPVGPLALTVLGGGAFAKYLEQARLPRISVSLEDAARVTSSQVFELVRYVEQGNPYVLQQVLVVLARDATTMAALGASVAAIVMQRLSERKTLR